MAFETNPQTYPTLIKWAKPFITTSNLEYQTVTIPNNEKNMIRTDLKLLVKRELGDDLKRFLTSFKSRLIRSSFLINPTFVKQLKKLIQKIDQTELGDKPNSSLKSDDKSDKKIDQTELGDKPNPSLKSDDKSEFGDNKPDVSIEQNDKSDKKPQQSMVQGPTTESLNMDCSKQTEEIKQLKLEKQQCVEEETKLRKEIKEFDKFQSSAIMTITDLRTKLEVLRAEAIEFITEKKQLTEKLQLSEKNNATTPSIIKLTATVGNLKKMMDTMSNEYDEMAVKNKELAAKNDQLEDKLECFEEEKNSNQEIINLKAKVEKMKKFEKEKETEYENLAIKTEQLKEKLELSEQNNAKTSSIDKPNQEIINLKAKVEKMKKSANMTTDAIKEMHENHNEMMSKSRADKQKLEQLQLELVKSKSSTIAMTKLLANSTKKLKESEQNVAENVNENKLNIMSTDYPSTLTNLIRIIDERIDMKSKPLTVGPLWSDVAQPLPQLSSARVKLSKFSFDESDLACCQNEVIKLEKQKSQLYRTAGMRSVDGEKVHISKFCYMFNCGTEKCKFTAEDCLRVNGKIHRCPHCQNDGCGKQQCVEKKDRFGLMYPGALTIANKALNAEKKLRVKLKHSTRSGSETS